MSMPLVAYKMLQLFLGELLHMLSPTPSIFVLHNLAAQPLVSALLVALPQIAWSIASIEHLNNNSEPMMRCESHSEGDILLYISDDDDDSMFSVLTNLRRFGMLNEQTIKPWRFVLVTTENRVPHADDFFWAMIRRLALNGFIVMLRDDVNIDESMRIVVWNDIDDVDEAPLRMKPCEFLNQSTYSLRLFDRNATSMPAYLMDGVLCQIEFRMPETFVMCTRYDGTHQPCRAVGASVSTMNVLAERLQDDSEVHFACVYLNLKNHLRIKSVADRTVFYKFASSKRLPIEVCCLTCNHIPIIELTESMTDICNRIAYVVVIPYAPNAYVDYALGEKSAFVSGWLIIVLVYASIRCALVGLQTPTSTVELSAIVIDTIARTLGVSVADLDVDVELYRWNRTRAMLLASLTVFGMVFASFYSSYLFTGYMVEVRGYKRFRHFEELINDTIRLTVPNYLYMSMSKEQREVFGERLAWDTFEGEIILHTNTAYILTQERADMLHVFQPNQFYQLRDIYRIDFTCQLIRPWFMVYRVNRLHRRVTESGIGKHLASRVRDTFQLVAREQVQNSDLRRDLTMLEANAWVGLVWLAGTGLAAFVLVLERMGLNN